MSRGLQLKQQLLLSASHLSPSISFASTPKIMTVGDSRQHYANNIYNQATPDYGSTQSRFWNGWTVAQAMMMNFYSTMDSVWPEYADERFFGGANQGVATKDSIWIAANRFSKIATLKPNACAAQFGINNGSMSGVAGSPAAGDTQIAADMATFVATCKSNNCVPIVETVLPSTSTAGKTKPDAINKILRDTYASDPTVIFIDGANYLMGTPYGFMSASDMPDGLHLGYKGSQRYGEYIASIMASYISAPNWLTTNSYTNLIPNAVMTGTSGTKGSRVTGTVPTNWRVDPDFGTYNSTCVVSISVDALTGENVLNLDITPVDNASHIDMFVIRPSSSTFGNIALGSAGASTNKEYINAAQFILPSNDINIRSVSPAVLMQPDGSPRRQGYGGINMEGGTSAGERRQWICCPTTIMDSTATAIQLEYRIGFDTQVSTIPFRVSMLMPRCYEVTGRKAMWA